MVRPNNESRCHGVEDFDVLFVSFSLIDTHTSQVRVFNSSFYEVPQRRYESNELMNRCEHFYQLSLFWISNLKTSKIHEHKTKIARGVS